MSEVLIWLLSVLGGVWVLLAFLAIAFSWGWWD